VGEGYQRIDRPSDGRVFTLRWSPVPPVDPSQDWPDHAGWAPAFAWFDAQGQSLESGVPLLSAGPFSDGLAVALPADKEALYGYLGPDGQWAVSPRFLEARDFVDGFAAARSPGGAWGILDAKGAWLVSPRYWALAYHRWGFFTAWDTPSSPGRLIDARTGQSPLPWTGEFRVQAVGEKPWLRGTQRVYPLVVLRGGASPSLWSLDGQKLLEPADLTGADWNPSFGEGRVTFTRWIQNPKPAVSRQSYDLVRRVLEPAQVTAQAARVDGGYTIEAEQVAWTGSRQSVYQIVKGPQGQSLPRHLFSQIGSFRGSLAPVLFGTDRGWGREGLWGIFDFAAGSFVVPPSLLSVEEAEGGLWYLLPLEGDGYLFDGTRGLRTKTLARGTYAWSSGPFSCYYGTAAGEGSPIGIHALLNDSRVRIRSAPSTKGEIVTVVDKDRRLLVRQVGTKLETIAGQTNLWFRVDVLSTDDQAGDEPVATGWIFGAFLNLLGAYEE